MCRSKDFMVVSLLAAGVFCHGQELSEGDRGYALSALHATRKQVVDATSGLSKAQWNYKATPESWSIAEICEHLALLEQSMPNLVGEAMKTPAAPEKKPARPREADARILAMVPQRTTKAQAPEALKPSGKFKDGKAALAAYVTARDSNLATMRTTKEPLREHFRKHPALGDLDAYQWYLLVAAHAERHVNQMLELKASPGYPKK